MPFVVFFLSSSSSFLCSFSNLIRYDSNKKFSRLTCSISLNRFSKSWESCSMSMSSLPSSVFYNSFFDIVCFIITQIKHWFSLLFAVGKYYYDSRLTWDIFNLRRYPWRTYLRSCWSQYHQMNSPTVCTVLEKSSVDWTNAVYHRKITVVSVHFPLPSMLKMPFCTSPNPQQWLMDCQYTLTI